MSDLLMFGIEGIETKQNTLNIVDIPLIDVIIIDNNLFGRLDIIIQKYFAGNLEVLPLIMSHNKITDPTEIIIGNIFEIPDVNFLKNQLIENTIFSDDIVPGISKTTNNKVINRENKPTSKTIASKLNISLEKVIYNENSGIIKF